MGSDLVRILKEELHGWSQVTILGLGNEFGGDDGLGLLAARKIKQVLPSDIGGVEILETGVAPENFTGVLRNLLPSHVILIDSAEMGEKAGYIKVINPYNIQEALPSTHSLPLSMLVKYIEQEVGAKVTILGIQPKEMSFGTAVSSEVRDSVDKVAMILRESLVRKSFPSREVGESGSLKQESCEIVIGDEGR